MLHIGLNILRVLTKNSLNVIKHAMTLVIVVSIVTQTAGTSVYKRNKHSRP